MMEYLGPACLIAVTLALVALSSCSQEPQQPQQPQQQGAVAPPSKVSVAEVKPERLPVVDELPGRVAPMVTADVRPRVTGIVLRRVFEQGSTVREGDLLYVIDPEPFKAKVDAAKATFDSATAAQRLARQKSDRQIRLSQAGVASKENLDTAVAELAQSNADVERARADLKSAELDLQYTEIRAPASGRIGRALVTEGALVSPTSEVMATIQQMDPIYADFTQPADRLITLKTAVSNGKLQADESGSVVLKLMSADGRAHPHDGKLLFSEATVNSATGQLILRGEFPNPDLNLLPGMYVRARIEQAAMEGALAVPEQAIQRDTAGKPLLYVVSQENRVALRIVTLGWLVDGRWVVTEGISAGERVVVEGFQRVAPGAAVAAEPWVDPRIAQSASRKEG